MGTSLSIIQRIRNSELVQVNEHNFCLIVGYHDSPTRTKWFYNFWIDGNLNTPRHWFLDREKCVNDAMKLIKIFHI